MGTRVGRKQMTKWHLKFVSKMKITYKTAISVGGKFKKCDKMSKITTQAYGLAGNCFRIPNMQ